VLDTTGTFPRRCNLELVELEALDALDDLELVHELMTRHVQYTGSDYAAQFLQDWSSTARLFVKVMPRDYKRVIAEREEAEGALSA
jgi:glutamate synthase domain-containing protein 3